MIEEGSDDGMRRFWRSLLTGAAIGASIGTYMYVRSLRQRGPRMTGGVARMGSRTRRTAGKVMRTIGEANERAMEGASSLGMRVLGLGRRLGLGRLE